jgi:hypothetical protein
MGSGKRSKAAKAQRDTSREQVKKRKRDKEDEGDNAQEERSSKRVDHPRPTVLDLQTIPKIQIKKGEVVAMEVDGEIEDDGVEVDFNAVVPDKYPTKGWSLDTPTLPQFYDDWYRPFFNYIEDVKVKHKIDKPAADAVMNKMLKGRSTRTVLVTLFGKKSPEQKCNLIFEATRKILGYVPELIALSKGNTWHLLILQNAKDAQTLVEQHTAWKLGTGHLVIYRKLTLTHHSERIVTVINLPSKEHVKWVLELLSQPWEGKAHT